MADDQSHLPDKHTRGVTSKQSDGMRSVVIQPLLRGETDRAICKGQVHFVLTLNVAGDL